MASFGYVFRSFVRLRVSASPAVTAGKKARSRSEKKIKSAILPVLVCLQTATYLSDRLLMAQLRDEWGYIINSSQCHRLLDKIICAARNRPGLPAQFAPGAEN